MQARKLLLLGSAGIVVLAVIGLAYIVFHVVIGHACTRSGSGSALNGGPEDPAIRDVEQVGGVCCRASDLGEYAPDHLRELEGNPVVNVSLFNGTCVLIRRTTLGGKQGTEMPPRSRDQVTDAALTNFHLLKEIRYLSLRDTGVTDVGMKSLVSLRKLTQLDLLNTRVTDTGLKEFAGFAELWELDLGSTGVTDAGMPDVARMQSLAQLNLEWTAVGDAGLAELSTLPQLYSLHVGPAPITDAGVSHLSRIKTLSSLDLCATEVTDAALKDLAKLTRLRFLSLDKTKVTLQAVKDLKEALPDCAVYLDGSHIR